jgi:hypothetical protein
MILLEYVILIFVIACWVNSSRICKTLAAQREAQDITNGYLKQLVAQWHSLTPCEVPKRRQSFAGPRASWPAFLR